MESWVSDAMAGLMALCLAIWLARPGGANSRTSGTVFGFMVLFNAWWFRGTITEQVHIDSNIIDLGTILLA